jgi:hypothetical protein
MVCNRTNLQAAWPNPFISLPNLRFSSELHNLTPDAVGNQVNSLLFQGSCNNFLLAVHSPHPASPTQCLVHWFFLCSTIEMSYFIFQFTDVGDHMVLDSTDTGVHGMGFIPL